MHDSNKQNNRVLELFGIAKNLSLSQTKRNDSHWTAFFLEDLSSCRQDYLSCFSAQKGRSRLCHPHAGEMYTSLVTSLLRLGRKVKNSQARTGHQRGMGGRGTDDDDTHEQHTDTNKLTRHTASRLPHTLSWRTHNSGPHPPCRPPALQGAKGHKQGHITKQTTESNM